MVGIICMFYEKFVNLCVSKGIAPTVAAQEAGFSNATATDWKNGSKPRKANLVKLANYFNVPVEYFSEDTKKSPAPKKGTEDFAKVYELLTPEHQEQIQEEILVLLKKQMQG